MFLSSFTMLVWTVWHHHCNRLVSVLPICYLKMELIFTLLVAFCRLSSLPLVGLTSRCWMCWMKTAGDWLSLILPAFAAFFFFFLFSFLVEFGFCLQNNRWNYLVLLSFASTIHKQCNCPKFTFQNASVSVKYSIVLVFFQIKIKIGSVSLWLQAILLFPDCHCFLQLILEPNPAN